MTDILFAEDEPNIREWVTFALEKQNYRVRAVADGAAALAAYREKRPDLLILDLMMPKKSGWDVCTEIRKTNLQLPIMMLSARSTEADKIQGLGLGADDYMTKPFGIRELQARVAALLRRAGINASTKPMDEVFRFGSAHVDESRRCLLLPDETEVELSALEIGVLRFLAAHTNEVVSRDQLLNGLWGIPYSGTNRTLDNRILALRKKLGPDAGCIETVYGAGYRYRPPAQSRPAQM